MKINFLTIFVGFYVGVAGSHLQPCTDFECFDTRLESVENNVENLTAENEELKNDVENLKVENEQIKAENEQLKKDVLELEKIVRPGKTAASCQEWFDRGETEDGIYEIKPNLDIEPFPVECRFSGEIVTTVITHDHTLPGSTIWTKPRGCDEAGCYSVKLNYDLDISQIASVIDISESCHQVVENNCTENSLTNFAWWTDRSGNEINYWDGDHPVGTKGCKCSLDGAGYRCDKDKDGISSLCNCDAGQSNVDVGLLTSLDQLPVMELNYRATSGMFSWIAYRIGNLECSGKRNGKIYPSEVNKNKMEKIDENANEIRQNQNHIGELKERTDENTNEIKDRTDEIKNEIKERTDEIKNELKERTDENKNEIKERTDENKNEIKERTDEIINEIGRVNNRTAENVNEIGQLKEHTAENKNEIGRVKERSVENKNEIDQLEKRIVENINEIGGVNNRTAENENEIGQLKERTDEKEKELIAVESRTTNLEANVVEDDFYYKYQPSSSYTLFKTGNLLQFGTKMSGNDAGYYDRYTGQFTGGHFDPATGQFTAPVDGRYNFRVYLVAVFFSDGIYNYSIRMRVNGSTKQYLRASGTPDNYLDAIYDGRNFELDYDLRKNDKVDFYIRYATSGLRYSSYSFVEGKLSKKNN